jgi:3-oxoadipate enol-lactonase
VSSTTTQAQKTFAWWRFIAPIMAQRVSVISLDVRGHGTSTQHGQPYSVQQFATDARSVVDALGYKNVIVAGASMGGCIALQFAIQNPSRTVGLGLFDTTAWYGPTASSDWAERAQKACANGLASLVGFQATRWFSDTFRAEHPDIVDACINTFVANDIAAYASTCHALGNYDGRQQLSSVTASTAIVVGEEDYATPPEMARALHAGLSNASLTIVPKARHLSPLEVPDVIIEKLNNLLDHAGSTQLGSA